MHSTQDRRSLRIAQNPTSRNHAAKNLLAHSTSHTAAFDILPASLPATRKPRLGRQALRLGVMLFKCHACPNPIIASLLMPSNQIPLFASSQLINREPANNLPTHRAIAPFDILCVSYVFKIEFTQYDLGAFKNTLQLCVSARLH